MSIFDRLIKRKPAQAQAVIEIENQYTAFSGTAYGKIAGAQRRHRANYGGLSNHPAVCGISPRNRRRTLS